MALSEVTHSVSTCSLPDSRTPQPQSPAARFSSFITRFTKSTDDAIPLLDLVRAMKVSMDAMNVKIESMESSNRAVSHRVSELEKSHERLWDENRRLREQLIEKKPVTLPLPSQTPAPSAPKHSETLAPTEPLSPIQPKMILQNCESRMRDVVEDVERERAIVLYGLPEFASMPPPNRALNDRAQVMDILSHLGIQAVPTSVFRMPVGGAPDSKGRLLKVIMPCSKLQRLVISRRHLLANFNHGRVWLRPSLTREERANSTDKPFSYNVPNQNRSSAATSNLKSQLETNEYLVYCFTESWLRKSDPDGVVLGSLSKNYNIVRCDRARKRGGESKTESHELLIVDLRVGTQSTRIILVYRVPALSQTNSAFIWENLDDFTKCTHPTVVVGDFNLPEVKWPLDSQKYNAVNTDFIDCCTEVGLQQRITFPTRGNAFLDLLLTDSIGIVENLEQLPNYGNSDHKAFTFQLTMKTEPQKARYVRNFRKADYAEINSLLSTIDWLLFFNVNETVNEMYEKLIHLLEEIIEKSVPLMRIDSTGKPLPGHIHRLSKKRHDAWITFLNDGKPSSKKRFEKLHAEYNQEVTKFHHNYERKIIETKNQKKFYGYIKSKLSNACTSAVDCLIDESNHQIEPMVEFSPSVAFPVYDREAGKLEKLQNKVTRLISYKCLGYNFENRPLPVERNEMLKLNTLMYRRKVNDFKLAYEMLFGNSRLSRF
ncbi:hypothetical protein PENTCL1PPCAC_14380 [Pristionchus entomophagus]|uniref:Endonuclease/exonuclease/phosphatase domain-containing protein n=1 Tax=Pristionchus entomophagus TaxID=358040 RepID=A0AAV5TFW3_9BILA|nr:hypothetical protein PENTCL1PPCAC_14380 [Pristionchus entomophagus]